MSWLQGQRVCFTGKGMLNNKIVTRERLEGYVRRSGAYHTEKSPEADILVASRTDTVKAVNAIALGKRVISYDEFWVMCGITLDSHLNGSAGGAAPPLDDDEREQERQKAIIKSAAAELKKRNSMGRAMEQAADTIDGWGSF